MSKLSGLTRTTPEVTYREQGDPSVVRRSPGQTEFAAVTMERGVTHNVAFNQWANKVWDYKNSTASPDLANQIVSLKDFRKDIIIELCNEAGQKVIAYNAHRC